MNNFTEHHYDGKFAKGSCCSCGGCEICRSYSFYVPPGIGETSELSTPELRATITAVVLSLFTLAPTDSDTR